MTPELVLSRATAGGAPGFAARCQSWFLRRNRWSRRLILMIFGAIAALAFPPVNALPLFAVGIVGADLGGGDRGAPPVRASRWAGGGASAISSPDSSGSPTPS